MSLTVNMNTLNLPSSPSKPSTPTTPCPATTAHNLVTSLYTLRQYYFGIDKPQLVANAVAAAVTAVTFAQSTATDFQTLTIDASTHPTTTHLLYLHGKALTCPETYNPLAETLLIKACKTYPGTAPATYWNALAECFWKKGSLQEAVGCYETGIRGKSNKEGLRELSILLRGGEGGEGFKESISRAKAAVSMDLTDPDSWYTLGNAYVSNFFTITHSATDLQKGVTAYNKACDLSDPDGDRPNPDLYFNRARVMKYLEEFEKARVDYKKAADLDPTLPTAGPLQEIRQWVARAADLVKRQGRVKPKRLKALCDPLHNASMPSTIKGSEDKAHTLVSLSDVTGDATVRVAVALKVLMPLGDVSAVPAAFLAVDREMKCVILSVYHLSEELTKKISEKDVVIVMQPKVKRMEGEGGEGYDGVQVGDPKTMLINGKVPEVRKFAPATVRCETFSMVSKGDE